VGALAGRLEHVREEDGESLVLCQNGLAERRGLRARWRGETTMIATLLDR
jgi:hypothetical protein